MESESVNGTGAGAGTGAGTGTGTPSAGIEERALNRENTANVEGIMRTEVMPATPLGIGVEMGGGSEVELGEGEMEGEKKPVPHIRIVPHIVDVRHCLYFDVIDRDVPENSVIKVGRFTDRVSQQATRIAFKSKVVSRSHAEIWTENGEFFIRDTKSSSGTFLNHMRLAPPGVESRPYPLRDGDILQLGVDYQGGSIDIYKCVKIRLEINRTWQRSKENPFRKQMLKNIQDSVSAFNQINDTKGDKNECCICLYNMVAFQALFVAPCSHCFHFKCVKPLLFTSTGFNCPLCRTYADLEASVTDDEDDIVAESTDDPDSNVAEIAGQLPRAVQIVQSQFHQSISELESPTADPPQAAHDADSAVEPGVEADVDVDVGAQADTEATPNHSNRPVDRSVGSTPVGSIPTSLMTSVYQHSSDNQAPAPANPDPPTDQDCQSDDMHTS